jgi:hypothetical protein
MAESKFPDVFVLGLSGKIGVGKDYIAKNVFLPILHKMGIKDPPIFLAFADAIKTECASRHGTPYNLLYGQKDAQTRERLQQIGDEIRKRFGHLYFVNWMKMQIHNLAERSDIRFFVITDVRFPEEVKMIHALQGLVYRVEAPRRTRQKLMEECGGDEAAIAKRASHNSEILLDNCQEFDGLIDNDPGQKPECICKHYSYTVLARYPWPDDDTQGQVTGFLASQEAATRKSGKLSNPIGYHD